MIFAACGPSPNTVWVASLQSGQARQQAASWRSVSIFSIELTDFRFIEGSARLCGFVAASAIPAPIQHSVSAINDLMIEASGRFLQYSFGLSVCLGFIFNRAGLKRLA
jgi:hypothetical protein